MNKKMGKKILVHDDSSPNSTKQFGAKVKFTIRVTLIILKIFLLGIITPSLSYAFGVDSKQPMELRADSADINQGQHIGTYEGTVEFDQGNTHIRANRATTKTDEHNKLIEAIIYGSKKSPAHYWSQVNKDKPPVHAYADTIKYQPDKNIIELIGNARVEQGENIFTAPHITYNVDKQHVVSSTTKTDKQRTLIIFHPSRKK